MVAQGYRAGHGRAGIITHASWPSGHHSVCGSTPGVPGGHQGHQPSGAFMGALKNTWGQDQPGPLHMEEAGIHHSPAEDTPGEWKM